MPNKLLEYREKIDAKKQRQAMLAGKREQLLSQLKKDYGVSTLKKGKVLLAEKKKKLKNETEKYENDLAAFEEEHKDVLE